MPMRAPTHKPARTAGVRQHEVRQPDRQKHRALNTGSRAWRLIRERVLVDAMYVCQECGQFGDHADHVNGDPSDNSMDNLQCLCRSCHSIKTAKEDGGFGNARRHSG